MAVNKTLCFKIRPAGSIVMPSAFREFYPECTFNFAGVNNYYGINAINVSNFEGSEKQTALLPKHVDFFQDVFFELEERERLLIVWALEPPDDGEPFEFVDTHLDMVKQLAKELAQFQMLAKNNDKTLEIVIRFASEMNDKGPGNHYAGRPEEYKASFQKIREIFRTTAPSMRFCFSPALRRDLRVEDIDDYWPGDDVVDIVACTWYCGRETDFTGAVNRFSDYCRSFKEKGKPFAIDELGGCKTVSAGGVEHGTEGDDVFQRMREVILTVGDSNSIDFEYVTLFLGSKWGESPKLDWL